MTTKSRSSELKNRIFLKVVRGLIGQRLERSVNKGMCAYRGNNGTKCAAGHLMNDKEYRDNFENNRVRFVSSNTVSMFFKEKYKYNEEIVNLVRECQQKHDLYKPGCLGNGRKAWASGMLDVYHEYSINSPTAKAMIETVLAISE